MRTTPTPSPPPATASTSAPPADMLALIQAMEAARAALNDEARAGAIHRQTAAGKLSARQRIRPRQL